MESNAGSERNKSTLAYTDEPKATDGIVAGITGPRKELSIPMGKYPSFFQAEVFAITTYAEIIRKRKTVNQHVACSDRQTALKAISYRTIEPYMLNWVPGHTIIKGSEITDILAIEARSISPVGLEPFFLLGPHSFKDERR
ncbi:uncharacterized protein LOC110118749 [Ceratitis capitata]|uniref:uncharacterized protein LOC110118749 n=1 Tax=Ceratitis capitata TaxID=7213 RepID=UPI000A0F467E|nr:uncharacterized protein LOC110118749 [Ceratitis capitata]